MHVDLVVDLYKTGGEHAQALMKRLGITYYTAVPQSMGDCWWFFNCRNVPDVLPSSITMHDFGDLNQLVGDGLNQDDVTAIYADRAG